MKTSNSANPSPDTPSQGGAASTHDIDAAHVPFPFFHLPSEIRNIIYRHLFTPGTKQNWVKSNVGLFCDQIGSEKLRFRGLSLLRTCQQLHEEGSAVLYGDNTFWFDDLPHNRDQHAHRLTGSGVFLLYCELMFMYAFLRIIGRSNRLKIRNLWLHFETDTFATFPKAIHPWKPTDLKGQGGLSCVSDALDFFSDDHQLRNLHFSFLGSPSGIAAFSAMFRSDSRIIRKLSQYNAIQNVECHLESGLESATNKLSDLESRAFSISVHRFSEIKSKLEAAYPQSSTKSSMLTTTYGFKQNPIHQLDAIADKANTPQEV